MAIRCLGVRTSVPLLVVAALLAAFTLTTQPSAQADTFGSGANTFTIDFVNIGNAGNAAQNSSNRSHGFSGGDGLGAVPYDFRIGTYEISQSQVEGAILNGLANTSAGPWTGNGPATQMSWYEMAAFVNWMNTSTGKQAAYDLNWDGSAWNMNLWSNADAWQLGGENLYRHKDSFYFLPSESEWFKAAYYNPAGSNYFLYPTGSNTAPVAVVSGSTNAGTAVYTNSFAYAGPPADVDNAGGLSPYGTMGQGGNAWDTLETAQDGINDSPSEVRAIRGGVFSFPDFALQSSFRDFEANVDDLNNSTLGFRVASVPEPSTYALLLMTAAGALWWSRKKR